LAGALLGAVCGLNFPPSLQPTGDRKHICRSDCLDGLGSDVREQQFVKRPLAFLSGRWLKFLHPEPFKSNPLKPVIGCEFVRPLNAGWILIGAQQATGPVSQLPGLCQLHLRVDAQSQQLLLPV
jgi:hypothetical protein